MNHESPPNVLNISDVMNKLPVHQTEAGLDDSLRAHEPHDSTARRSRSM